MKRSSIIKAFALAALLPAGQVMAQATPPEPTYTIGSNELDIVKFIQTVAAATGKTMVIDPAVKGKVRVMTNNNALNKVELYELFRSVLELSNFTVVEVGGVVKVIPLKEARTSPLSSTGGDGGLHEVITEVLPVKNISATKLNSALRPMVSSNYSLTPLDASNSFVITDTRANIERVRQVIALLDKAAVPATEIVKLEYSEADALVQVLTKLSTGGAKDTGAANKLQMVADKRNNAIIIAGEDVQRERMKRLILSLDKPAAQTGNVRVVYLEYADAKKVAETLTKVVANITKLGPGGDAKGGAGKAATVEADEDTNALLITAEGDTLESLLAVVERLDIRRAQVLVEAIIVEINIGDNKQLGTEWLFANENEGIVGAGPRGSGTGGGVAQGLFGSEASLQTIAAGIASVGPGNALAIAGSSGKESFMALMQALNESTKANILSTPTLLTMDNSEAEISVGQEVPFATGSYQSPGNSGGGNIGSPFTTFQRESVGIMLKVTPQINEGDKVLLDIEQEVSDIEGESGGGGIITKQSKIVTQVMAKDGEIIVLGGLIEESTDEVKNKVPILGSIPLLGYFFKYQSTKVTRKNLMVFLRAEIVRDDEVMSAATAEKYEKIRELQIEQRERGLPLMKDSLLPVLPEVTFGELNIDEGETSE